MTDDQAKRRNLERARQHQEMASKYSAYRDFVAWLDEKIAGLDQQWHLEAIDMDVLQQLRGQKAALESVKMNIESMQRMDVSALMQELEGK
jgi:hypothetical protein